jgi:hypothetical protein
MTVSRTLIVSSGTRAVGEILRPVPLFQDERRVERPDQAGGRQLGAALDEHEFGVPGLSDLPQQGGLAGARRPFEQDVGARRESGSHQLKFALAPYDLFRHTFQLSRFACPGCQCSWIMTPRTFLPASRSS